MNLLFDTVLVPVATTVLLLAAFRSRSAGPVVRCLGSGAFILAAGWLAGYLGVYGRPALPPLQALDWLPALLLLALVVLYGALARLGAGMAVRFSALAAFVIAAAALLSMPLFRYTPDAVTVVAAIAVPAGWLATALLHDRAGDDDASFGALVVLVAAGNAVIAALTGSVMLGQLSGVLAAVLAAWWLWGAMVQRRPLGPAGRGVALAVLALLLLIGQLYGNTPLWATLLLFALLALHRAVAPLSVRRAREGMPPVHALYTVILAALPLAAAIYFIARNSVQPGEF